MPNEPDPIAEEAKRRGISVAALRAFYRGRLNPQQGPRVLPSKSRGTGALSQTEQKLQARTKGAGALSQAELKPRRPGILGYIADRFDAATGN